MAIELLEAANRTCGVSLSCEFEGELMPLSDSLLSPIAMSS